jgi:uncharacterized membrane protein
MAAVSVRAVSRPLHPLHSILLAFPPTLFVGALASDITYWMTFQIQWSNFSSWLIAGGLLGGGFAVVWALINVFRLRRYRSKRPLAYFGVLLVAWVLGFVNALVHAKDAWAIMPEGLLLSAVTALLALGAAWIGYSGFSSVEAR